LKIPAEISTGKRAVLAAVLVLPNQDAKGLAQSISFNYTTVTKYLTRLQRQLLVNRDGYPFRYVLTEPGLDRIAYWLGNSADFEEFIETLQDELTTAGINLNKYLQVYKPRVFGK
jgi:predicted transcriptional regulator